MDGRTLGLTVEKTLAPEITDDEMKPWGSGWDLAVPLSPHRVGHDEGRLRPKGEVPHPLKERRRIQHTPRPEWEEKGVRGTMNRFRAIVSNHTNTNNTNVNNDKP